LQKDPPKTILRKRENPVDCKRTYEIVAGAAKNLLGAGLGSHDGGAGNYFITGVI
jgi:hypothetical protein